MALFPAAAAAPSRQGSLLAETCRAISPPQPSLSACAPSASCRFSPIASSGFNRPSGSSILAGNGPAAGFGRAGTDWRQGGGGMTPVRRLSGPLHVRARTSNGAVRQVNLVDPLTAKQLAEEDMGRRKEAARKQRFRDIEAFNGGWAVLGLTAALVGESRTGEGVLGQLAVYLDLIAAFLEALEKQL